MKTELHVYFFDVDIPSQAKEWTELQETLKARGLECFRASGEYHRPFADVGPVVPITLETNHLFRNQWNTGPIEGLETSKGSTGFRVFDWALGVYHNRSIMAGHYLTQTPEMREIRRNTMACGYCGKQQPAQNGAVFCDKCMDSEYLKSSELPLLRMVSIEDSDKRRPELTQAERDYLMPLYVTAQTTGSTERGIRRLAKARKDVESTYQSAIANATAERDGMRWLIDQGFNTSNVIYYSHTGRFGFGWRQPVGPDVLSRLLEVISEFPGNYDIKCADGRTLSN